MPALQEIKWSVLKRYGLGINSWIETGTFLGDTTKILSEIANQVTTIEPSEVLHANARERFKKIKNVRLLLGTSEDLLGDVLSMSPVPVALWLDGHFSGGITFEGRSVSPILYELKVVEDFYLKGGAGVVFVDDVRLFDGTNEGYPAKSVLVDWAERNSAWWTIEHDIFVARFGISDSSLFNNSGPQI